MRENYNEQYRDKFERSVDIEDEKNYFMNTYGICNT